MEIKTFTQHINEKVGVSSDGEILSDFLADFLAKAEPGNTYVFIKDGEREIPKDSDVIIIPQLPELQKNVYKVYVDYSTKKMGGTQAFFDPKRSRYTKNGYILYFTFLYSEEKDNIWKHYIYHEIHHGIQFLKMGKKRMLNQRKNVKFQMMRQMSLSIVYKEFLQLLYHTIEIEEGALIAQFYGKLKHRKNIKRLEDLQKYFQKRNIHEYRTAYKLAYCDMNKLFNAKLQNPKTGKIEPLTNRDDLRLFFTMFKKIGKKFSEYENIEEFTAAFYKETKMGFKESDLIDDKELDATVNKYTKYFNKEGRKLIKKLDKTYSLLVDYFTDKFENPEKYKKKEVEMPPAIPPTEKQKKEGVEKFIMPEGLRKMFGGKNPV